MAYHDANGKITIDDAAANHDIALANSARECLQQVDSQLVLMLQQTDSFEGETALALRDKSAELLSRVRRMTTEIEEMVSYTRSVVAHYKAIDES